MKVAILELPPMSTGQPPPENPVGEKGSSSESSSADEAAKKSEVSQRHQAPSIGDRDVARDAPTTTGGTASPPTSPSESIPPKSSPLRGKFTVGSLLGATQASAAALPDKRSTTPTQAYHRQQIGALPQRPSNRSSTAAPSAAPPPTPNASAATALQAQAQFQSGARKVTPSQPFTVQPAPNISNVGRRTTPPQPFGMQPSPERRHTPPQPFAPATPSGSVAADASAPSPAAEPAPHRSDAADKSPAESVESDSASAATSALSIAPIIPIAATPKAERAPVNPMSVTVMLDELPKPTEAFSHTRHSASQPKVNTTASIAPKLADGLDEPGAWEVATDAPVGAPNALKLTAEAPVAEGLPPKADERVSASKVPVAQNNARVSDGKIRASKDESTSVPGIKTPSSSSKLRAAEAELSGDFFSASQPPLSDSGLHYEMLDERQRRSLSPEVVARRSRYRIIVVLVVVGLVLLLGAAVALKMLHRH